MKYFLSLTAMAAVASATTGIMLPIYRYPIGEGKPDWDAVIQAATDHPKLPFYIVVDNNKGAPYDKNPPENLVDWAAALGALNPKDNVFTLGYISTNHSTRTLADVERGIDQYAAWTTQAGWDGVVADVSLDGIFFDEIETNPSRLSYNKNISTYARSTLSARNRTTPTVVVLNPGVPVQSGSESLFDLVDAIVQIETCHAPLSAAGGATDDGIPRCPVNGYTPFSSSSLNVISSQYASKSSVLVHDYYESWTPYVPGSEASLEADVKAIIDKKVHSFYITQYGYNANFTEAPASITNVARLAAQDQGLA
ncbi:Spherulation-specific family 4-domain-containing protein [Echria macrotheca]|uniref:Spherulation-specific family 4-domain-containing protein n=1 Tax=Echria macrotheca TaxID=438768 RepID=A0AAJ0F2K6_9PEZI|nr:Spherulation-specific family 4-domain-containing protein [Echria macrotheca]